MAITTITTKGQVTIPKEIRDYLNIDTGSKVDFVIDENGIVTLIPLNVPVQSLSGILHRPGMKTATLEEMEIAIKEGSSDWS
ncbi:MAG: AbrB/MazE/SpoVT family DNA-binding domain-containing protein [Tolypothrix brevis GSE-NOS-MK-07-07A]|jgi:AbrB family looped-hinge helix DNA binding protein|uniref:AbrB/MazE/SpoVT family DNA-binding domain-containing protein n=1 Tax=Scytonema hofmannii FACHB-248 TaxID=1842502 RepID=A0ABR8GQP8_9CYAN|nr:MULTISPECIES: AbrB/MazE/SpoVT family DNA-binding domain-containing protein [Nostocales]AFZ03040.1 transcriptional regulator, AbrB family [Calothrix sp. PCC 6303]AKG20352.1 AbrB family transcriptional regulator [Calothrix sp. 336/3]MBD2605711.1 AbrB/MazE/SpoVT family DNA-binding domain-containing protein [Scytonema hofmannii FACHB-248]MBW4476088.1 AbrB/MazE/SpoVT family DNA-binding domain-containing protein [Tolypothrix brevis GSE-NOS-MK-07-07A]